MQLHTPGKEERLDASCLLPGDRREGAHARFEIFKQVFIVPAKMKVGNMQDSHFCTPHGSEIFWSKSAAKISAVMKVTRRTG